MMAAMQSYKVPIYIAEFAVLLKGIPGTNLERYEKQVLIYKEMLEVLKNAYKLRNDIKMRGE